MGCRQVLILLQEIDSKKPKQCQTLNELISKLNVFNLDIKMWAFKAQRT